MMASQHSFVERFGMKVYKTRTMNCECDECRSPEEHEDMKGIFGQYVKWWRSRTTDAVSISINGGLYLTNDYKNGSEIGGWVEAMVEVSDKGDNLEDEDGWVGVCACGEEIEFRDVVCHIEDGYTGYLIGRGETNFSFHDLVHGYEKCVACRLKCSICGVSGECFCVPCICGCGLSIENCSTLCPVCDWHPAWCKCAEGHCDRCNAEQDIETGGCSCETYNIWDEVYGGPLYDYICPRCGAPDGHCDCNC